MGKYLNLRPNIVLGLIFAFLANTFGPLPVAQADEFRLPAPGVRVGLSPEFNPPILKGIKVHPDNPFRFDFILDKGDGGIGSSSSSVIASEAKQSQQEQLKQEATRLIKYFLASLTIPENDLWVNLSPYEKNHIIPQSFGLTEMGRDLLAEDYMLKQITASLIYPEDEIGKKFWKRIYEEAVKKFGTTNIHVNTFNKVWIVPEKAVVYENAKAGTAYVVESKLKVMLEQDYLALSHNVIPAKAEIHNKNDINVLGSQIVREIIIPELTKEVNEGKNFAQLRQVYNSLILATWYKKKIKDSILSQIYTDRNKVQGLSPIRGHVQDGTTKNVSPSRLPSNEGMNVKATQRNEPNDVEIIYQHYLQAFKKGAYNYIKEEIDPITQQTIPRKYFSGGLKLLRVPLQYADGAMVEQSGNIKKQVMEVTVDLAMNGITAISPDYYSHVINPIQNLLRRKQIHGQRGVIISITGLAGTGKTPMGAVLKNTAFEGYESDEIATIDTDNFIPKMHMDESGIYRGKRGEILLPTDDATETFQSHKFKLKMDELRKQNKLVIVTGIHVELFLERIGEKSTIKILLDPSNELETRLWAIIRDGDDAKFLASKSYMALQQKLAKESVIYDLTLHVIPIVYNNISKKIEEPVEFKFSTASLENKQYGDLKDETSFLIHGPHAIASALSSLPVSLEQIKGVPNFNILIKGVLPAVQYLFDQGNSEIYFTVKRYSNGVWIILNALQGDIPPYAKGWSRASPFLSSIQNSPEVIFLGKKHGYARTVDRQFHKKDIIDRKGAIGIALGYSEIGMKQPQRRMISQFDLEDSAMISNAQVANNLGGIDLSKVKMDSRFRGNDNWEGGNDNGIQFRLDHAMLEQLQNAPGFTPVIINIQPMNNLREFLGLIKDD